MAEQLIDSLSAEFDPGKYRDEYRERVLGADRAQGRRARRSRSSRRPRSPPPAPDLMAALEASLAAVRSGDERRARARRPAAKPATGRRRTPTKTPTATAPETPARGGRAKALDAATTAAGHGCPAERPGTPSAARPTKR